MVFLRRSISRLTLAASFALVSATAAQSFQVTMSLFIEDPLSPIIHGSTNLPNGSALIVTLSRPESRYMAQANVMVHAGHFLTERFSQDDRPLNPGAYKIDVSMSMASLQPPEVQAVIGEQGERMSGSLITPETMLESGKSFGYSTVRQLGGRSNAALDAQARAVAAKAMHKWAFETCRDDVNMLDTMLLNGTIPGPAPSGTRAERVAACYAKVTENDPPTP